MWTGTLVRERDDPLAEAKTRFSEMEERVDRTQDHIVVTRNGRPTVVVMSVDELRAKYLGGGS